MIHTEKLKSQTHINTHTYTHTHTYKYPSPYLFSLCFESHFSFLKTTDIQEDRNSDKKYIIYK